MSFQPLLGTDNTLSSRSCPPSFTKLWSAPHPKPLCSVSLPQDCIPVFSAADWAMAVCTQMEGKAGGSPVVAKGSGNAKGIQGALTTALEFARSKL